MFVYRFFNFGVVQFCLVYVKQLEFVVKLFRYFFMDSYYYVLMVKLFKNMYLKIMIVIFVWD